MPLNFTLGNLFVLQSNSCLKQANRACSSGLKQRIKEATEQAIKGKEKKALCVMKTLSGFPLGHLLSLNLHLSTVLKIKKMGLLN